MPEFKKNRNPILMKATKGGPIYKNYISPVRKDEKGKVTKGDVVQTIAAPLVDARKTIKVVKATTPKFIKKGYRKLKKWWKSPANY